MESAMVTRSLLAHGRPAGPVTRCVLAVVVAGALAALAACGGMVAGSGQTPAAAGSGGQQTPAAAGTAGQHAALCADAAQLDRLVVSLSGAAGHFHEVLPRGLTVTDPLRVRAVASALCGLPAMPHGPLQCPADFGGSYRFSFAAAGQSFPPVIAKATGCQSVSGLGPARMASAAFWALLQKELGGSPHMGGPSGGPVAP
jgi:hypothetical protein